MTYHRVCNNINTAAATGGAGTASLSGALKLTPGFRGLCCSIFSFLYNILYIIDCSFYSDHWIVCPLIDGFWYFQTFLQQLNISPNSGSENIISGNISENWEFAEYFILIMNALHFVNVSVISIALI